jgi:Family of unknown function (DUF6166)
MMSGSVERFYCGKASGEVTVREGGASRTLAPRPGASGGEPKSFTWGRNETGATQLAFALLADALSDDAEARRWHQNFRHRVISNFPERWTITRSRILAHVDMMRYRGGAQPSVGQIATRRLKLRIRRQNSD